MATGESLVARRNSTGLWDCYSIDISMAIVNQLQELINPAEGKGRLRSVSDL